MTLLRILDYAVPIDETDSEQVINEKKLKRAVLSEMIESYKRGEIMNFDPMCISADIEELIKKYLN